VSSHSRTWERENSASRRNRSATRSGPGSKPRARNVRSNDWATVILPRSLSSRIVSHSGSQSPMPMPSGSMSAAIRGTKREVRIVSYTSTRQARTTVVMPA